jgi:Spy/CpxP family protein refolding chaperone
MRKFCILAGVMVLSLCPKLNAQSARLSERIQDLHLTDQQEAKIAEIRKEFRTKVKAASESLGAIVKEEMEKARAVLTQEQKNTLTALKEERKELRAAGLAERIAHLEELDLTDAEMAKIAEIRKEYRSKIDNAIESLKGILTPEQRQTREDSLKANKKRREVMAALNLTSAQKGKVEDVTEEVTRLVRQEINRMRDMLTEGQKEKLQEFKEERREQARDRTVLRIAGLKSLNLTDSQINQIGQIRQQYRTRVHEAGNVLRAIVREELEQVLAVIKG